MQKVAIPFFLLTILLIVPQWGCQQGESESQKDDAPKAAGQEAVKEEIAEAVVPLMEAPEETQPLQKKVSYTTYEEVSVALAQEKRCLSCHEGIEVISYRMAKMWGADTKCEVCHRGNPTATTKKEAHKNLIVHPGDLRVQALTCGQCHDDGGVIRKDVEGLIPGVKKASW